MKHTTTTTSSNEFNLVQRVDQDTRHESYPGERKPTNETVQKKPTPVNLKQQERFGQKSNFKNRWASQNL